jgi:iron(III) transport system substrate-binding protein
MGRSKNFLLAILLVGLGLLAGGCTTKTEPTGSSGKSVLIAGMPEQKLLPDLIAAYNKSGHHYVFQYQPDISQPADYYLTTRQDVQLLAAQGKLAPFAVKDNQVPALLKDEHDLWYGVFYDPVVFLVNHQFARQQGQEKLLDWQSLPQLTHARLVMENLADNNSTKDFLAALSTRMGQAECLQYFKSLQPLLGTFGKFPITSIRMVAGGDADLALTRSSFVAPYLESDFPAYVQVPEGGTPVTLYAFAQAKTSREQAAGADFLHWLLTAPEAQKIIQPAGYYLVPTGIDQAVSDTLWLNTFYKDSQAVDKLVDTWVKAIRLGTTTTEVKK